LHHEAGSCVPDFSEELSTFFLRVQKERKNKALYKGSWLLRHTGGRKGLMPRW